MWLGRGGGGAGSFCVTRQSEKKKKEKHTHTQKKSWVSWEGEKKEKLTGGYSKMYSLEGKWICQWLAPNEWQKTGTSNSFVCGIIDVCSSCLPCVCRTCLCKHTHAYKQQHRAKKNEKRIHKVSESSRREGIINRIFTSVFGNRSDGAAQLQLGAATKKVLSSVERRWWMFFSPSWVISTPDPDKTPLLKQKKTEGERTDRHLMNCL